MAPSNQILLAKNFSNILVNIMKLEDRFNQFETTYLQRKFQTSEDFLIFESKFYEGFKYTFNEIGSRKKDVLQDLKENLKIIQNQNSKKGIPENKKILPQILNVSNYNEFKQRLKTIFATNKSNAPERTIQELLEINPEFQPLIFKVLKEIKSNSNIDIIDKYIKEINSKNSLNQLNSNIDTANIDSLDLLISLKRTIEDSTRVSIYNKNKKIFTEQDFNRILIIINNLIKQFSDYNFNEKLVRTTPVLIDEYKENLENILAIFIKYDKYKTKKEVENFTNLVNNMSKPIKKHFNGLTITFAFVTRLLKYLVIKLINEKVSNSSSAAPVPASAAAQKNKSIYNPRKIKLVPNKLNVEPMQMQIILMRPTITKGDIFRMLSRPETYKECREKELGNGANKISKIGKDLFNNNRYKDFKGHIFYFEEGESTADLFTNTSDKTKLESRQQQNVIAKIGELWEQILDPQPGPQLILICEPSDIQRIFGIKDFANANGNANANSIQKMPYASGIKVKMYVEDYEKFYFENESTLSINGSNKTLSPTDKDYVKNVIDWYKKTHTITLSCDLNIGQI